MAEGGTGRGQALIRVVIADDHPLVRDGTCAYLAQSHDMTVVGAAGKGMAALELVRRYRPDVLVLDLHLPDISGLDVVRCIQAEGLDTAVLILTGYEEVGYIRPLVQLGARGYLSKTATADEIVAAVRSVATGQLVLDAAMKWAAAHGLPEPLTAREFDVLQLIVAGQRNLEIAATLSLSLKTVEFHISHILAKLGARSRSEAVRAARELGLLY